MTSKDELRPASEDPLDRKSVAELIGIDGVGAFGRARPKPLQLFTVKDVAENLGVSSDTVYSMIHSGELKAIRLKADPAGKRFFYRIKPADYENFLNGSYFNPIEEKENVEEGSKKNGTKKEER